MKLYITISLVLLINVCFGQITNVRSGVWNDPTVWSNNSIPTNTTHIILSYDIQVNINAACKSLNTNGHQVIVNAGMNLFISGVAAPGCWLYIHRVFCSSDHPHIYEYFHLCNKLLVEFW